MTHTHKRSRQKVTRFKSGVKAETNGQTDEANCITFLTNAAGNKWTNVTLLWSQQMGEEWISYSE